MNKFKKFIIAPLVAAVSLAGSYLLGSAVSPFSPKDKLNTVYCSTPLVKPVQETIIVDIGVIIDQSLESKIGNIEKALNIAEDFYYKGFGILLNFSLGYIPDVPEYTDAFDLPIPEKLSNNNAYIFLADKLKTLAEKSSPGTLYIGECSNAKIITAHQIHQLSPEAIALVVEHEIAHLFYADDLEEEKYERCLMHIQDYFGIKNHSIEVCEPTRSTILKYRDRIW